MHVSATKISTDGKDQGLTPRFHDAPSSNGPDACQCKRNPFFLCLPGYNVMVLFTPPLTLPTLPYLCPSNAVQLLLT